MHAIFGIIPWIPMFGFVILLISPKPINSNYDMNNESQSSSQREGIEKITHKYKYDERVNNTYAK
jgi:hypothetical protein